MRTIIKRGEPRSLIEHRAQCGSDPDYANLPAKGDLRVSLVAEQRGICCYCMQRIRPNRDSMKIEHWHSQAHHRPEQLHYGNLLGACLGGIGQPKKQQHCDTRKGDSSLCRNPADARHSVEEFVHYGSSGEAWSQDRAFDRELTEVLNLNLPLLVRQRREVLDGFVRAGRKRKDAQALQRLLDNLRAADGDDLKPYSGAMLCLLKRKLGGHTCERLV